MLRPTVLVPLTSPLLLNNDSVSVNYVDCNASITHCSTDIIILVFLSRKQLLFSGKSIKTVPTGAALFGSNMHQIVCRFGLRSRPHWGDYSARGAL